MSSVRPLLVALLVCAFALGADAQLPHIGRATDLTAAFPQLHNHPELDWPYFRDPNLRLEAAPLEFENAYTNALDLLTAREASRAEADAALAAAEAREAERESDVKRLAASISASKGLLDRMKQPKVPPGDSTHLQALDVANASVQEMDAARLKAEARLALARSERESAEKAVKEAEKQFNQAASTEFTAGFNRKNNIDPAVLTACPVYEGLLVQSQTVLVRFRDDHSIEEIQDVLDRYDLHVVGGVAELSLFVLTMGTSARPQESEIEHVLRLNRTVRSLSAEPAVFTAVQQITLTAVKAKPTGHTFAFNGPCWDWYEANSPGQLSASRIALADAWQFLDQNRPTARIPIAVTVLDQEFDSHDDLDTSTEFCAASTGTHGNKVLGLIAGTSGKTKVTTGAVAQFATCGVKQVSGLGICGREAALTSVIDALSDLFNPTLLSTHKQQIINVSLGYNWAGIGKSGSSETLIQDVVKVQGGIVRDLLAMHRDEAIIVTSAGNDSGDDAKWGSPMNWAALGGPSSTSASAPSKNVAVVDAVKSDGTAWVFTDINGSLAAPGVDLLICTSQMAHDYDDGTSLSAPVVSGVAALMLAQNPNLKPERAVSLLISSAKSRIVNARAAIETAQHEALREAADLNGDDVVDWADYVLLRNVLHGVPAALAANKSADLNGDGQVSLSATHAVASLQQPVTDLQVMQAVWEDTNIAAATLDGLLNQQ